VLTDPEKYPNADYHGKRVYFCTRACLRAFEENPDGFMNGEVEHPEEDN
jgi:YHS domain-containing protein